LGSRVAYVLLGVEVQVKVQKFKLKHTYIATGHHNVLQNYPEEVTISAAQYIPQDFRTIVRKSLQYRYCSPQCLTVLQNSHISRFANNVLLRGEVRVRVWIREQRKTKRRSKALLSFCWQSWTSLSELS